MEITNTFFIWWFEQWGIGGWVIFFLLAVAAIAWTIYDSQSRRIRALSHAWPKPVLPVKPPGCAVRSG